MLTITNNSVTGVSNAATATRAEIPDTVTSIGNGAFQGCTKLATVTFLGTSVCTTIGTQAFVQCAALTSITIPATVTSIGLAAFAQCAALTSITIPATVTSIGQAAFAQCAKLATVTFAGVSDGTAKCTTIGTQAFAQCPALTSITIPATVTSIRREAFQGCAKLLNVTFQSVAGLTTIGTSIFAGTLFQQTWTREFIPLLVGKGATLTVAN